MANYKSFNYKELAMDFSWYAVPQCDQEYLRTMMMEVVTNNSVNATGVSFNNTYPNASNFALFMSKRHRDNYLSEFTHTGAGTASHLLTAGRKYYAAWVYEG